MIWPIESTSYLCRIDSSPIHTLPFGTFLHPVAKPTATMILSSRRTADRRAAISWILVLAFLSLTLFPHHYHMHQVPAPAMQSAELHEHVTHVHDHAGIQNFSHQIDSHTVQPVGDASLNTPGVQLPSVITLMIFSLVLLLFAQAGPQRPLPVLHRLPRFNRHSTPPLRAPPRT